MEVRSYKKLHLLAPAKIPERSAQAEAESSGAREIQSRGVMSSRCDESPFLRVVPAIGNPSHRYSQIGHSNRKRKVDAVLDNKHAQRSSFPAKKRETSALDKPIKIYRDGISSKCSGSIKILHQQTNELERETDRLVENLVLLQSELRRFHCTNLYGQELADEEAERLRGALEEVRTRWFAERVCINALSHKNVQLSMQLDVLSKKPERSKQDTKALKEIALHYAVPSKHLQLLEKESKEGIDELDTAIDFLENRLNRLASLIHFFAPLT